MIIEGYRKSLKHPEAEEFFDLLFYRPVAYPIVRLLSRTPVTPNQVTFLSLVAALISASFFARGNLDGLVIAAAWYALSNVLDCADGQLARLRKSGTPHGRIVDGTADYVGTVAVFTGIGIGLSALGVHLWLLVVAAGISTALHALIFDHRQNAFISASRGEEAGHARESVEDGVEHHGGNILPGGRSTGAGFLVRLHDRYMKFQSRLVVPLTRPIDGGGYDLKKNAAMIRLWSFLGPTTNRTALIAFALIGRVDLYLWGVVIAGNVWLLSLLILQKQMETRSAGGKGEISDSGNLP